ncbi:MAG: geranylgeranyl reductase family protein [Candidatus Nanopelagicales bacterium]|nr:geranylgeranyl reductase family protein [Candidatus Nanopelagicales bacterium]
MDGSAPAVSAVAPGESSPPVVDEVDVIVVGAGPAGSTTAFHLAQAGLDVLLLEKTAFPREKVCGDGLTPRAVRQLVAMGIDVSESAGWLPNRGVRIMGGGHALELDWPRLASFPDFGLVRRRAEFDEIVARRAESAGARLVQRCNVTGPIIDDRTKHIVGVTARSVDEKGRPNGDSVSYRSRLVVAADGNSSRLSVAMGLERRRDRPMAVAVRTYIRTPNDRDDRLETWVEICAGGRILPGYGWIFPMGDGTVNVGIGMLNTDKIDSKIDYRDLMARWLREIHPQRGLSLDDATEPIRGAALPMAFNRQPHYTRGLLLVGDAGGMVNPFNGEGIAYAMESGALAARVMTQALARQTPAQVEQALSGYPRLLREYYGGYYTMGRWFLRALGDPRFMRWAVHRGLGRRRLMELSLKMMGNLSDKPGADAGDRLVNALQRLAPKS